MTKKKGLAAKIQKKNRSFSTQRSAQNTDRIVPVKKKLLGVIMLRACRAFPEVALPPHPLSRQPELFREADGVIITLFVPCRP